MPFRPLIKLYIMWEYFLYSVNALIFAKKIKKNMSDTDDSGTIQSTPSSIISTPSSIRRKRTANTGLVNRSNQSHTAFFFRIDGNNSDIAYCKICERTGNAYPYSRKGGNTSGLIAHLRDKHNITKNNYAGYLDDNKEV